VNANKPEMMKKSLITAFLFLLFLPLFSQSFNTGEILRPGRFSLGINPVLYDRDLGLYVHGGYGINKSIDLAIHYGVLEGIDYFGADLEWSLKQSRNFQLSLVTGGHIRHDPGLDGSLCVSFRVADYATIFSGLDMDIDFDSQVRHFTWLPAGIEVYWRKNASIILEADIPVSDWAWNIFGGGLVFYF
jgi:hypothetical protein